jgi:hypothetical protein
MRRGLAAVVVVVALAPACAYSGLTFREDTRFAWRTPGDGERVELPVRLRWEMDDFSGSFVVFFDREPMRPGERLIDLVGENDGCRQRAGCPDTEWLLDHHIYPTDSTEVVVADLPDRSGPRSERDVHTATVVLLDASGRRQGESVFVREFAVQR